MKKYEINDVIGKISKGEVKEIKSLDKQIDVTQEAMLRIVKELIEFQTKIERQKADAWSRLNKKYSIPSLDDLNTENTPNHLKKAAYINHSTREIRIGYYDNYKK